jgi:hypothetical protein
MRGKSGVWLTQITEDWKGSLEGASFRKFGDMLSDSRGHEHTLLHFCRNLRI